VRPRLLFEDRDNDEARDARLGDAELAHEQELVTDLGLETLFSAMAAGDPLVLAVSRSVLLAEGPDARVIAYRQAILADCLDDRAMVLELYALLGASLEAERKSAFISSHVAASSLLHSAIGSIELCLGCLEKIRRLAGAKRSRVRSSGFARLFETIEAELDDELMDYARLRLAELRFRDGLLMSAELGEGCMGSDYRPRRIADKSLARRLKERKACLEFEIAERDEEGSQALSELRDRGLASLACAVARARDHILAFLGDLRTELAFYVACVNLNERLAGLGMGVAMPEPRGAASRALSCVGLYDPCLALVADRAVVGNDIEADGKELIVVTGANQGGKSTFLRSVGQAQLMMQCGMFVAAESFAANLCPGVFTHFRRSEDASMTSGRLDEELARMSRVVDLAREGSLLLFNESFMATNEREGSEIARRIVGALIERRIKIVFVTHLYEFARVEFEGRAGNALFLRAQRMEDGSRTYKIMPGDPLDTSYGKDLYDAVFGPE
jgi:hypothetical protein